MVSKAVIQAPRRGEIPRVQIADLCEGCISLSNAEGLGLLSEKKNGLSFHSADIVGLQKISSLIDRQKPFQCVPADNGLAPHFEDGQLSPFHQLPHGVPADTRTLEQKASLLALLRELKRIFPRALIVGHHDLNPTKACPCFDAEREYRGL